MEESIKDSESFSKIMLPICIMVFCSYMTIGISLGVLPGFLHNTLNYNNLVVGIVIGMQSLATLLTRKKAGQIADTKGVRISVKYGTVFIMAASLVYIVAILLASSFIVSICLIIVARILLGASESLQITAALSWGIGRAGKQRSGKVMAWNGVAMFGGLSVGAPVGILLQQYFGTMSAFSSIIVISFIGWFAIAKLKTPPIFKEESPRLSFGNIVLKISKYGFGLLFSAIAFSCIASFITLLFQDKGWTNSSLAFILFGTSYIGVRIFFAFLTDKYGGNKIAFVSLVIQLIGQLLLWNAHSPLVALIGAFVTGMGFSLVFPAFGVEALKNIVPQMRSTALGAYVAFFDIALAVISPLAGIVANHFGYQNVFALGVLGTLIAVVIALVSLFSGKSKISN